jgi:conjugative transfer signal peptidase TraF
MAGMHGVDWSEASPAAQSAPERSSGDRNRGRLGRRRCANPARTVLGLLAVSALTTALTCIASSHLVWNRTASLPLGLYYRSSETRPYEGGLVALRVPPTVRPLVHERRYLPDGSLLIKPVAAVAGDFVCTRRGILYINGEPFGRILPCDSEGRELPAYEGCGALPEGQVFLASHHPGSFDSRSFGPVDIHALQGTVTPLWTF